MGSRDFLTGRGRDATAGAAAPPDDETLEEVCCPDDDATARDLIAAAESALGRAKALGRGRVCAAAPRGEGALG